MPHSDLRIRAMTPADAPVAVAWALAHGWHDRTRFYELVFRTPTCQAVVGEVDGSIVAAGVAVASGPVGWLGGLFVDPAWRRRGYGRAVMDELVRRLHAAGCRTLSLEATDAGRPMYEQMGFRVATSYHQLRADRLGVPPEVPEGARLRHLEPDDLPAVFELDRAATAEDRSAPLRSVFEMNGGWLLERPAEASDGTDPTGSTPLQLAGFLLPSDRHYGAVIARRFEDGLFLVDLHRSIVPAGDYVRAGIPHENEAAWRELLARGWTETWLAPRMLLGPSPEWRPEWHWGMINSAMG